MSSILKPTFIPYIILMQDYIGEANSAKVMQIKASIVVHGAI